MLRMTIINNILNDSIGTTEYALLTDMQIAAVLCTALNPNNCFLPINNPIHIPFLLKLDNALIGVKRVARRPCSGLHDELIHSNREILHIDCPFLVREDVLWNLGVDLSD